MKTYKIEFHIISETGYETTIKFEHCYDIELTDRNFSFIDTYSGNYYNYHLKDIPISQSAKVVDKIKN